ncbi:MAG: family 10 glycosylhydrolase [Alkalinema sp. RU_4_3]|nr:family 10 glycosylhydrolase [Alkalinema sp. RU_4_3]
MGFVDESLVTRKLIRRSVSAGLALATMTSSLWPRGAKAEEYAPYCQQNLTTIAKKDALRAGFLKGDRSDRRDYEAMIKAQAEEMARCRRQNPIKAQGMWIRLYPCDVEPGRIDEVFDRIIDRGYNEVYVETFFNGEVMLPANDNPTAFEPMLRMKGLENRDLLAEVIEKGRARGLKVYSWMFSLNFGRNYAIKPDNQKTLIKNGRGQTSTQTETTPGLGTTLGSLNPDEAFIDPYHVQVRQDYRRMMEAVLKRKPDGVLFDYIRYPRLKGRFSVASKVTDLWIYGEGSRSALLQRAQNEKGRELMQRYVTKGELSAEDVTEVDQMFPAESAVPPLWQGRNPSPNENALSPYQRQRILSDDLWRFSVAHAMQGVVDFLAAAAEPAQKMGIPTGAVFFPGANQTVNNGFDSRLQPWDRFSNTIAFYPMSYATCGTSDCILREINRVVRYAPQGTSIRPVLAGIWQQSEGNRPPLEVQTQAVRESLPQIDALSHFAYSWQEPKSDRDRKFCRPTKF